MRDASSRVPANWQAPPVETARRPAATSKPEARNRFCTSSKISSRRAWMMRVSMERGTRRAFLALLAHLGHRNDIGADFEIAERRPEQDLDALGGRDRRGQHARDVGGDAWPPSGTTSAWTRWPSMKTAMEVTPPPMSITVAPICFSSSVRAASPLA